MSIKLKFIISLFTILIICGVGVFHTSSGSKEIIMDVTNVKERIYPKLNAIKDLIEYVRLVQKTKMNALREKDDEYVEDMEEYVWAFDAIMETINSDMSDATLVEFSQRLKTFVYQPLPLEETLSVEQTRELRGAILEESNTLMIDMEQYRINRYNIFQQSLDHIRERSLGFEKLSIGLSGVLILVVAIISLVMIGIVRNIQSLVNSANLLSDGDLVKPISHSSKGELGSLQIAFEKMRLHLKDYIDNLDTKVVERTHQLLVAKQEMDDIMGAVEEGIFTFNMDKSVNAEHSVKAKSLFDTAIFEESSLKNLLEMNANQLQEFDLWLSLCMDMENLPRKWDMFSRLSPVTEICKLEGESIVEINYRPITVGDKLTKIMVLARDITQERATEVALAKSQHEQESMMRRVLVLLNSDSQEIKDFLAYAATQVDAYEKYNDMQALVVDVEALFRALHTLKGHSGTLGFDDFAENIARAEHFLDKIRKNEACEFSEWIESLLLVREELDHILVMRDKIFRRQRDDRISIDKNLYDEMLKRVQGGRAYSNLEMATMLGELSMQPFDSYCEKYRKLVKRFSNSLDKPIDDLVVETPDKMIHRSQMKKIDDAVVHIIRNAIDHGIEDEETRDDKKKGPGKIGLSLFSENGDMTITISDDGAGVDPDKIAAIAIKKNIIHMEECNALSNDEKINLIFAAGVTGTSEVSELSGRGVGMDAVSDIMKELGGDVRLNSTLGMGTTFTLRFPMQ